MSTQNLPPVDGAPSFPPPPHPPFSQQQGPRLEGAVTASQRAAVGAVAGSVFTPPSAPHLRSVSARRPNNVSAVASASAANANLGSNSAQARSSSALDSPGGGADDAEGTIGLSYCCALCGCDDGCDCCGDDDASAPPRRHHRHHTGWKELAALAVWALLLLFGANRYAALAASAESAAAAFAASEALEEGAVRIALAANSAARAFAKGAAEANSELEGFGAALSAALVTADGELLSFGRSVGKTVETAAAGTVVLPVDDSVGGLRHCLSAGSGAENTEKGSSTNTRRKEGTSLFMCPLAAAETLGAVSPAPATVVAASSSMDHSRAGGVNGEEEERSVLQIAFEVRRSLRAFRRADADAAAKAAKGGGARVLAPAANAATADDEGAGGKGLRRALLSLPRQNNQNRVEGKHVQQQREEAGNSGRHGQQHVYRHYDHLPNTIVGPIDSYEVFLLKLLNTLPSEQQHQGGGGGGPHSLRGTAVALFHEALERRHRFDRRTRWATDDGAEEGVMMGDGYGSSDGHSVASAAATYGASVNDNFDDYAGLGNSERGHSTEGLNAFDFGVDVYARDYEAKRLFFLEGEGAGKGTHGDATGDDGSSKMRRFEASPMGAAARAEHGSLRDRRYSHQRTAGRWRRSGGNGRHGNNDATSDDAEAASSNAAEAARVGVDVAASVASPAARAMIGSYYRLYRYRQAARRIAEVRSVLEPLITAVARRNDTMLYNYI